MCKFDHLFPLYLSKLICKFDHLFPCHVSKKIEKYLPVRSGTCCPIVWADRATDGTPKMEPPKIVFQNESKIDNNILSPMSCVNSIIYSHVICPKKMEKYLPLRSAHNFHIMCKKIAKSIHKSRRIDAGNLRSKIAMS